MEHYISNEILLLEQLNAIIESDTQLKLSEEAVINIESCYRFLEQQLQARPEELEHLFVGSMPLLRHYACGIGERIPNEIVKLMLFLKIQSFSYGYSGVRLALVQRLIDFYNHGVFPVVYSKDIPDERIALAHLALPLFGEGEVCIQHKIYSAQELEAKYGWQPLVLEGREADALLNGTQLTTAYGVHNLLKSLRLIQWADFVASVSTQVFGGNLSAFSEAMQVVRPHKGLIETAEHLRNLLKDSTLNESPQPFSSMPEAFCSIPQIHGAVRESIAAIRKVIKTEMNSVTDNPILFPETQEIIFGGNSHTLPLSLAMDFLAITLTSLGNISERRVFYLLSNIGKEIETEIDYPIFQRIIEGILNENRRLSTPASIESPILFEKTIDIKGMGGSSAIKCVQVVKNIEEILAIELILATSLWKKKPLDFHSELFKEYLTFMEEGEVHTLKKQIERTIQFFSR
ncbi:histidine ammonia-lyase [Capnocytophaga sp. HP1101]